jgi:hypothetical protein
MMNANTTVTVETTSRPAEPKVLITERALVKRINRALARRSGDGASFLRLRVSRSGSQLFYAIGRFYLRDLYLNCVSETGVDIEELGRSLGVMRHDEGLPVDGD